jgi:hypothetical protein
MKIIIDMPKGREDIKKAIEKKIIKDIADHKSMDNLEKSTKEDENESSNTHKPTCHQGQQKEQR